MSTRPSVYPEWATTLSADGPLGGNNRVEPSSGDKATGFLYPQQPPREWFNWLLYTSYQWIQYLDEELISGGSSSFAQDNTTTTGLTFGYKKGAFSDQFAKTITEVSAGTIALTASQTNWIAYRPGTGIVKVVGAWSGSTLGDVPLWKAVTDGSAITALTDVRSTVDRSIVQFANTARLYGRSTAGAGNGEEITIGSGLQLTGGTLSDPYHASAGRPVRAVTITDATSADFTDQSIPWTDAVPVSSQGLEVLNSGSYTPLASGNKVTVEVTIPGSSSNTETWICALFAGSTCIGSSATWFFDDSIGSIKCKGTYTFPSASAVTFSARIGSIGVTTYTVAGLASARKLGGSQLVTLEILETTP